jgi:hypothetical protein
MPPPKQHGPTLSKGHRVDGYDTAAPLSGRSCDGIPDTLTAILPSPFSPVWRPPTRNREGAVPGPCIDLAASRYGTVRTLQRNRRTSAIMPTGERHSAQ